jgi:Holliday junction resolvase RusA-like endonuclease
MNNILLLTIPGSLFPSGSPEGKQRARQGGGHFYDPQAAMMEKIKRHVRLQLPKDFQIIPKNIPVIANNTFFMAIPKSRQKKNWEEFYSNEDVPHIEKPDRDNGDKLVLDFLSKIIFADDKQVYDGRIQKYYSLNPRVEIEIIY